MAKIKYMKEKTANNMMSSLLIHPGEMIKDEIVARGLTQKELAQQIGGSYTVFNEILNGKRPVTTEYASVGGCAWYRSKHMDRLAGRLQHAENETGPFLHEAIGENPQDCCHLLVSQRDGSSVLASTKEPSLRVLSK